MFTVFNMDQLPTVAAGDICHHEVFNGLLFRIVIVVRAASQPNAYTPVDLAVCAVDVIDHVVRDQDIAVVNRHVPLNRVTLQMAEFTVGYARTVHLIMKTLAQNGVVGLAHGNAIDKQVTHHSRLFTADVDLGDGAEAAHRQPFNDTVGATHVQRNVMRAPLSFPNDLTVFLEHKPPAAVALQRTADQQGFAIRNENAGIDVFTG